MFFSNHLSLRMKLIAGKHALPGTIRIPALPPSAVPVGLGPLSPGSETIVHTGVPWKNVELTWTQRGLKANLQVLNTYPIYKYSVHLDWL